MVKVNKCCSVVLMLLVAGIANAQDSVLAWVKKNSRSVDMQQQPAFVKAMQPVLKKMAGYSVVGLGEGTHGTSEFQTVRTYISQYLAEKEGFNIICLENSFGWCVELNDYVQTGKGNLDTLMRKNMLGMWQNEEIKALLQWMKDYNATHTSKLQLAGMDYSETNIPAALIKELTARFQDAVLDSLTDQLVACSRLMDDAYAAFNLPQSPYKWNDVLQNGVKAYEAIITLKERLKTNSKEKEVLSVKESALLNGSLLNSELAFYSIYKPVKEKQEASRDESMAKMVRQIQQVNPGSKVLVWAHNAHIAKGSIFPDDSNGGGSGMYLEKYFPGQYFAVATATDTGTISATKDRFILSTSRMTSYPLPAADIDSWEKVFMNVSTNPIYIDLGDKTTQLPAKPFRFTGYGVPGKKSFIPEKLPALFDGLIFIPQTQATHMQQ
ncbi:MAG: erythromycin esterase family protein [Chitinophagaceae bacterium]